MNYKKIYDQLIEHAISRNYKKFDKQDLNYIYLETHHIVPLSLGGNNDKTNLVNLTYRENIILHICFQ